MHVSKTDTDSKLTTSAKTLATLNATLSRWLYKRPRPQYTVRAPLISRFNLGINLQLCVNIDVISRNGSSTKDVCVEGRGLWPNAIQLSDILHGPCNS